MDAQDSEEDLNRQEHIANEISLTRCEIILTDYESFNFRETEQDLQVLLFLIKF